MEVRVASVAGRPSAPNEDYSLVSDALVGVFDGVTQPAGMDVGCSHGTAWYVRHLAARLLAAQADALDDTPLSELLATAIDRVRSDHGDKCDLQHPGTPASTVCLGRMTGSRFEYLVLCDSPLVLDFGGQAPEVVTDPQFERAISALRGSALVPGDLDSSDHQTRVRRLTELKWEYTNQDAGYWIAASNPRAAFEAVTGYVPLDQLHRAALLTDGASCAVDQFHLFDWVELLDVLAREGPAALIQQVRAAERADGSGSHQPRYKRHDDATALLCTFAEEDL